MNQRKRRAVGIRRAAVVTLMLGAILQLAGSAHAQLVTGTIIGTVTDQSRAVLPGVTATITSPVMPGGPSSVVTDEQGRYRFAGLGPGSYTLKIVLAGFSEYVEELRVTAGGTVERNMSLTVATVAETITVTGRSPLVDTRSAAMTATTTLEVMENLPTQRNQVTDYLQAMPGVALQNPGGYSERVTILGSRQSESMYIHDGVLTNETNSGASGIVAGDIDGVEEIQTTFVGPSAEFASASGGVVNVVTKAGTNTFRGDAQSYWKPDRLASRPIKLDCNCPDGKTGFHMQRMRDYSAHLGGPIRRDQLWFFTGFRYDGWNYTEPGNWPAESQDSWWGHMTTKLTWQATETAKVSAFLKAEPFGGYATGPTRIVTREAATVFSDTAGYSYGGEVHKTLGNNTALTVRAGGVWGRYPRTSLIGDLTTPRRTDNLSGIASQGANQISHPSYRRDSQQVKLERYIARPRVTHTVRGGFQHERSYFRSRSSFPSGVQYYDLGGVPDYGLFQDPSVNAGAATRIGAWGENQMTIGDRLTVTLGLRFDHLVGTSPDEEAIDATLRPTGRTIAGLGDLFTWDPWSPRVGVNVKLTADGRTVLRGTYSRVYRDIFLNEIQPLHPGIATTTEALYDPATRTYSRIVSVTDPRANITINRDLKAPRTNAFSIGLDRELLPRLGLHTSYIFKDTKELIGWRDIGGIYGQMDAVLPDGRTLTVYPRLNRGSDQLFQRTNPPGWFDTYHGWVLSLEKRLANRWRAQANLTLSRSQGLLLTGNGGRDPNDLTYATGRLRETDRPVMFNANAMYDIPVIDVRVSAQYLDMSNIPFAPQALVLLPQGRRAINIEPNGTFRAEAARLLYLRFNKFLFQRGPRRVELFVNINNLLQNKSPQAGFVQGSYFTFNYYSPQYGVPVAFVQPRHMYLGARLNF